MCSTTNPLTPHTILLLLLHIRYDYVQYVLTRLNRRRRKQHSTPYCEEEGGRTHPHHTHCTTTYESKGAAEITTTTANVSQSRSTCLESLSPMTRMLSPANALVGTAVPSPPGSGSGYHGRDLHHSGQARIPGGGGGGGRRSDAGGVGRRELQEVLPSKMQQLLLLHEKKMKSDSKKLSSCHYVLHTTHAERTRHRNNVLLNRHSF